MGSRWLTWSLSLLLGVTSTLPVWAQEDPIAGTTNQVVKVPLNTTGSWNDCFQFKVEVCTNLTCFIDPVGVKFKYQQPNALIEASCRRGTSGFKSNNILGAVTNLDTPAQQDCMRPARGTKQPMGARYFYDVHVYGYTPIAYYQTSATPMQATLANTCGVAEKITFFVNLANILQNFNLSNFLSNLNPAAMVQNMINSIQSAISNMVNMITNLPATIANALQSLGSTIANMPANLMNSLQTTFNNIANLPGNIQNAFSQLSKLDISNLFAGGDFFGKLAGSMGEALAAIGPAMAGFGALQAAAMAASNISSAMNQGATGTIQPQVMSQTVQQQTILMQANLKEFQQEVEASKTSATAVVLPPRPANLLALRTQKGQVTGWTTTDIFTGQKTTHRMFPARGVSLLGQAGAGGSYSAASFQPLAANQLSQLPPDVKTGGSQYGFQASINLQQRMLDDLAQGGQEVVKDITANPGKDATEICLNDQNLYEMKQNLTAISQKLAAAPNGASNQVEGLFFVPASYLPDGFPQVVSSTEPNPACPLTHAGVVPAPSPLGVLVPNDRPAMQMVNCHRVCGLNGDPDDCKWAPLPGYGGSCTINMLSTVNQSGYFPACNGQLPKKVANYQGQMVPSAGGYRADLDHLAKLNSLQKQVFTQAVSQALAQINPLLTAQNQRVKATGQPCALPVKGGDLLSLSRKQVQTFGQETMAPSAADLANNPALNSAGALQGITSFVNSAIDRVNAIFSKGSIKQAVRSQVGQVLPIGLYPAFMSEDTTWSSPKVADVAMSPMNIALANVPGAYLMLCSAPSVANSLGFSGIPSLNGIMCDGTWGTKRPTTGLASNQYKPVAAMLTGYRGHDQAVALWAIKPNTHGTQQFNYDNPINKSTPFTMAAGFPPGTATGKFKGSKCYDRGTMSQSWFTAGESIGGAVASGVAGLVDPMKFVPGADKVQTEMAQGDYNIATSWKHTACCLTLCGMKHEY